MDRPWEPGGFSKKGPPHFPRSATGFQSPQPRGHYPTSRAWNPRRWREDGVNGAAHEKARWQPPDVAHHPKAAQRAFVL
jgi:hypothetical protein